MKGGKRGGIFFLEAVLSLFLLLVVSFVAFSIIESYSQNKTFLSKERELLSCINSLASKIQEEKCSVDKRELSCGNYLLEAEVLKENDDGIPYFKIRVYEEGKELETKMFYCP